MLTLVCVSLGIVRYNYVTTGYVYAIVEIIYVNIDRCVANMGCVSLYRRGL